MSVSVVYFTLASSSLLHKYRSFACSKDFELQRLMNVAISTSKIVNQLICNC